MKRTIVVAALAGAAAGCQGTPPDAQAPAEGAVRVTVVEARRAAMPERIEAGGILAARDTALVSSRIMAPVVRVLVQPGDRVRAGQPLVQLDDRALRAQHAGATAAARAAEQERLGADAEIAAARAALDLAQASHRRVARLHERRSATDDELDEAVAALAAAQSRLDRAHAGAGQAAAGLEATRAAADVARVNQSWATISAPFPGVVTESLVEAGNMAAPGSPLLRIESAGHPRVEVRVDASRALHVRPGDAVLVSVEPQSSPEPLRVTGRVAEVSRAVSPGAQSLLVKVDLPEGTAATSGTFARVRFAGRDRSVLAVPRSSVTTHGQLTSVFVVEGERTRLRLVTTGMRDGDLVEITAGLEAGERIVEAPAPAIIDGLRVIATRAQTHSEGAPAAFGGRDPGPAAGQ